MLWLVVNKTRIKCEIKELACVNMAQLMSGTGGEPGASCMMGQVMKQTSLAFTADHKSLLKIQGEVRSAKGFLLLSPYSCLKRLNLPLEVVLDRRLC